MLTLMVIMAAFTLGSCTDDDQDTAYYLAGAWQGQINDGNETYDVHMYFNQDNWTDTYGTGWESDNGWYSSSQAPFHWRVVDGYIHIVYDDGSRMHVVLSDAPMDRHDNYMNGSIVDYYTGQTVARFWLSQTMGNSKKQNVNTTNFE